MTPLTWFWSLLGGSALDPGKHTIGALEPKSGLQKTVEIELFEGEKNRRVVLEFDAPKPSSQPSTWLSAPASASGQPLVREVPWPAAPQSRAGIAWPTYLFGGLAVASFATAIAFGVRGVSQEEERLLPCKPRCLPSEVDAVQANYIVADVALGLGIVSTGLAAYFLISSLTRTTPKKSEAALVPLPMPGGGVGLLTGRF